MSEVPDSYIFIDPSRYCDLRGEGGPVVADANEANIPTFKYRRADLPATDAQAMQNEKVRKLVEALEWISKYRKDCHAYDDDMDYTRRDFDEGDLEKVERKARTALAQLKEGQSDE